MTWDPAREDVDLPRFTLGAYLRDRWLACLLAACACALVGFVVTVLGASVQATAFVVGVVALCAGAGAAWDYVRQRRFWGELRALAMGLERARELPDLLGEPAFLQGLAAYRALECVVGVATREEAELREQQREHGDYVELWIHEAKTPIAAMKLMLSSMVGVEAEKLRGELERIEGQVEQALYATRSTTLSSDYAIREVALEAVVAEALKRNARLLVAHEVAIELDIPEGMRVLADRSWLVFCLQQVIVNAAKYGARHLRVTAWEEAAGTARARTVLAVADDGCGIPASDVPRVFERGFIGQVGRAHGSATGMGLYLVRDLCDRMGLGLELESEEGAGTEVRLSFPHDRRRLAALC